MKLKYVLAFLAVFAVNVPSLWADPWSDDQPIQSSFPPPPPVLTPRPSPVPDEKLVTIAVSPLVGVPVSHNTAGQYDAGVGTEIYLSYAATPYFSVGLDVGFQDYAVNTEYLADSFQRLYGVPLPAGVSFSGDWRYAPVMALSKYYLGPKGAVRPYLLLGAGIGFNGASITSTVSNGSSTQTATVTVNENDFLLAPGFGVAFRAGDNVEIFTQIRLDMEFTSQNGSDTISLEGSGGSATEKGNLSDDSPTFFIPFQAGLRFL